MFADKLAWARTYLKQAGLVQDTRRSHFKITERGLSVLAEKPTQLRTKNMERFAEFVEFTNRSRKKIGGAVTANVSKPASGTETIGEHPYPKRRDRSEL